MCNFFVLNSTSVKAQIHHSYYGDTLYIERYELCFDCPKRYSGDGRWDLKEKLDDGHYFIHQFSKEESLKLGFDDIYMEGRYIDSLRFGRFNYFVIDSRKKNTNKFISNYSTFLNGQLFGPWCMYQGEKVKWAQGFFIEDKKNGFFIEYWPSDPKVNEIPGQQIKSIENFKNGILNDWEFFDHMGVLLAKGFGDKSTLNGDYYQFHNNGDLKVIANFDYGVLKYYEVYFPSSKTRYSGRFEPQIPGSKSAYDFNEKSLIEGTIEIYDLKGNLISKKLVKK